MGDIAGIERTPIGSSENPFGMAPSSDRFYANAAYEETCNTILDGIRERRGLIVLTGAPGTGKTTLVQHAITRLDKSSCSVLFCSFHPALDETLNSLCQHLGLSVAGQALPQKLQQLNQTLLARSRAGESTAFVVDDAHTLDARTLAQILLLVLRTSTGEHLLQVVLVGLPELGAKLRSPECQPSLPAGFLSTEVGALPPAEVAPFIEHQLGAAPATQRLTFTAEAMRRIAAYSTGIPREINALCGLASVIANLESSPVVTEDMVEEIKGERSLWGVGVEAQTPSITTSATPQPPSPPVMSWTSVHATVYPPSEQLKAINDSEALDASEREAPESSPTWVVDENTTSLEVTPASTAIHAAQEPKGRGPAASPRWQWQPSWWLTGSALAFSVLALVGAVLWRQAQFSDHATATNATDRATNLPLQESPEAEIEFAQMRPAIRDSSPDSEPPTASTALSAIAPRSAAEAAAPESSPMPLPENQAARSQALAPAPTTAQESPKAGQQLTTGTIQRKEGERPSPSQANDGPVVALSRPDAAAAAKPTPRGAAAETATPLRQEPADESTQSEPPSLTEPTKAQARVAPASPEMIPGIDQDAPTARTGSKPSNVQQDDAGDTSRTVAHAKPASSPSAGRPADATNVTGGGKKPPVARDAPALPSILGSVDSSGYQSMENNTMDEVTAQMLPVDPDQVDLHGFRQFLSGDRQPGAGSGLSGPAALGSSSTLPLNSGSLPTFSGR